MNRPFRVSPVLSLRTRLKGTRDLSGTLFRISRSSLLLFWLAVLRFAFLFFCVKVKPILIIVPNLYL